MKTFFFALSLSGACAYMILSSMPLVQQRGFSVQCDDGTEYSMPMATKAIAYAHANTANAVCTVSEMKFQ